MYLSVIVPVYNCSQYLNRCIESIVSQSYKEIELILVDDGSTDDSSAICRKWADKDSRIKVIHRENGGLSAARNTGIAHASSDYITFVDSDDEIIPDTYAPNMEIIKENQEIDLLEFPIAVHYGAANAYTIDFQTTTDKEEVFQKWIEKRGYLHCYACNKIYRKRLFDIIQFPEGETFEDAAICPTIIECTKSICYSEYGKYLYHSNNDSITNRYTFKNQEPLFRHNCALLSRIIKENSHKSTSHLWIVCLNLLIDLKCCKDADDRYITSSKAFLNANRPSLCLLNDSGLSTREKIKFLAATVIGTSLLTNLLSFNRSL